VPLPHNVVVSALESKVDDLYRGPLSEFVSARNALAKTLSGDDAKAVRALAKPTVVPWAVNQVYWHARAAFDRVMKSGEKVRKAQIAALEGRSVDVRAASDAHRRAVAEAVGEAQRLSASAGSAPSPDALSRTIERLFGWAFRPFNRFFRRSSDRYQGAVSRMQSSRGRVFAVYAGLLVLPSVAGQP